MSVRFPIQPASEDETVVTTSPNTGSRPVEASARCCAARAAAGLGSSQPAGGTPEPKTILFLPGCTPIWPPGRTLDPFVRREVRAGCAVRSSPRGLRPILRLLGSSLQFRILLRELFESCRKQHSLLVELADQCVSEIDLHSFLPGMLATLLAGFRRPPRRHDRHVGCRRDRGA